MGRISRGWAERPREQVHDVVRLAVKRLAFCKPNPDPGGTLCKDIKELDVQPKHNRFDGTRPADIKKGGGARAST